MRRQVFLLLVIVFVSCHYLEEKGVYNMYNLYYIQYLQYVQGLLSVQTLQRLWCILAALCYKDGLVICMVITLTTTILYFSAYTNHNSIEMRPFCSFL